MRHTGEGAQVVLAQAGEGDIAHHDHFVMARLEGHAEVFPRIVIHALEKFFVHFRDTPGRFQQAVTSGVVAEGREQLADGIHGAGAVHYDP
jgi:hypothetical protein